MLWSFIFLPLTSHFCSVHAFFWTRLQCKDLHEFSLCPSSISGSYFYPPSSCCRPCFTPELNLCYPTPWTVSFFYLPSFAPGLWTSSHSPETHLWPFDSLVAVICFAPKKFSTITTEVLHQLSFSFYHFSIHVGILFLFLINSFYFAG